MAFLELRKESVREPFMYGIFGLCTAPFQEAPRLRAPQCERPLRAPAHAPFFFDQCRLNRQRLFLGCNVRGDNDCLLLGAEALRNVNNYGFLLCVGYIAQYRTAASTRVHASVGSGG